jgi:multidrug resistance efflux pump
MADLFRKNALDTMSTPEQLDKQVKIMPPSMWIIYIAFVAALVTFIIWCFTYKISNGVSINGVVFTSNNIISNSADRECMVTDVLVKEGDHVDFGSLLAVVSNDSALEKIENYRTELAKLDENDSEYKIVYSKLNNAIENYTATTMIKANHSGYVQSVQAVGTALTAGDKVASIMPDNSYNEVVAFVPTQTATNLSLGMEAQISPSYAAREEYGYMYGHVTSISDTPCSEDNIIAKMGTLSYVDGILPDSSYVEVRIRLEINSNRDDSENTYKWSNSKGEQLPVKLGTQCSIVVVTSEYYPIDLLIS